MKLNEIDRIIDRQLNTEEIFVLRMRCSMSPTAIAESLGITPQTVHNILKRAKAKIKEQESGV